VAAAAAAAAMDAKSQAKAKLSALQAERDAALASGDKSALKMLRRRIHGAKRRLRRASR
jgi:hypothetical protein